MLLLFLLPLASGTLLRISHRGVELEGERFLPDSGRTCWRVLHTKDHKELLYLDGCGDTIKGWVSVSGALFSLSSSQPGSGVRRPSSFPVELERMAAPMEPLRRRFRRAQPVFRHIQCRPIHRSVVEVPIRVYVDAYLYAKLTKGKRSKTKILNHLNAAIGQARELFSHSTIQPKIKLRVLERPQLWRRRPAKMPQNPGAFLDYFHSFCNVYSRTNVHSVLLTGYDGFGTAEVGLSEISGLCSADRSCSLIKVQEEAPNLTGLTMAHELGHNLGMRHDQVDGCDDNTYIMSANRVSHIGWSSCSRRRLETTLGCLNSCLDVYDHRPTIAESTCVDKGPKCELFARRGDCAQPAFFNWLNRECPQACAYCFPSLNIPTLSQTRTTVPYLPIRTMKSATVPPTTRAPSRPKQRKRGTLKATYCVYWGERKKRCRTSSALRKRCPNTCRAQLSRTRSRLRLRARGQ